MRATALFSATAFALGMAAPAHASEAYAGKVTYKSTGAYMSQFFIEYDTTYQGKTVRCRVKANTDASKPAGVTEYDLWLAIWKVVKGSKKACLVEVYDERTKATTMDFPEGVEFWGLVKIDAGEVKSCRKDKKIISKKGSGKVRYKTGGGTLTNNRCKVYKWP